MKLLINSLVIASLTAKASAQLPSLPQVTVSSTTTVTCGTTGGNFTLAGSSTVRPLAEAWAQAYGNRCGVTVNVEGGESSAGAGRLCDEPAHGGGPVEIGTMSRDWKPTEATSVGDGTFQCLKGDTSREAIQVDVRNSV